MEINVDVTRVSDWILALADSSSLIWSDGVACSKISTYHHAALWSQAPDTCSNDGDEGVLCWPKIEIFFIEWLASMVPLHLLLQFIILLNKKKDTTSFAMVGIIDVTACVWSMIAQKKLLFQSKVKIFSHSGDRPVNATNNQTHETLELKKDRDHGPKEVKKEEVNSRAVKFSTSQIRIHTYNAETDCRSLIWYNSADLKQFKEDRLRDTFKIMNKEEWKNDEEICWWGLERLIVPSVGSKVMRAREMMKQVVLRKQDEAYLDRQFKEASEWAAKAAQEKAMYYYSHLYDNGPSAR